MENFKCSLVVNSNLNFRLVFTAQHDYLKLKNKEILLNLSVCKDGFLFTFNNPNEYLNSGAKMKYFNL